MIKCAIVTIHLITGAVMEHTATFRTCDDAARYVELVAQRTKETEQVIGVNYLEDATNDIAERYRSGLKGR